MPVQVGEVLDSLGQPGSSAGRAPVPGAGSNDVFILIFEAAGNGSVTCHAKVHARFAGGLFLVNCSHREVVPARGVLLILLKIGVAAGLVAPGVAVRISPAHLVLYSLKRYFTGTRFALRILTPPRLQHVCNNAGAGFCWKRRRVR